MIAIEDHTATKTKMLTQLYQEVFPGVARFIHKQGGSFDDAKDVFQEALLIYYEKVIVDQKAEHGNAYLFGIARNLWYKRHRELTVQEPLESENTYRALYELSETDQHPSFEKLLGLLMRTGQKCMELLRAFYYDKMNMQALSKQFGFAGERSATVQKYKCLEKVRDEVKTKDMRYEDFFE